MNSFQRSFIHLGNSAVMNGLLQWLAISMIIAGSNGAIVPPPWSDPQKNPCANMPGGWQLLYWAPLRQCFKIFTVCHFHKLFCQFVLNSKFRSFNRNFITLFCECSNNRLDIHVRNRWNWHHRKMAGRQLLNADVHLERLNTTTQRTATNCSSRVHAMLVNTLRRLKSHHLCKWENRDLLKVTC